MLQRLQKLQLSVFFEKVRSKAKDFYELSLKNKTLQILEIAILFEAIHLLIEWPLLQHINYRSSFLCQWDCQWYKSIILDGYHKEAYYSNGMANFAFFPLVPLLAKIIYMITGMSAEFSLIFVSELMFFFCIIVFMFFVEKIFQDIAPSIAAATFVFMPFAVHSLAGYTETTFFLLTMLVFLSFYQKEYVLSGMLGAFLSITRSIGVWIVPALVLPRIIRFFKLPFNEKLGFITCFMLMPLGLFLFMFYLWFHVGDALAFFHTQRGWRGNPSNWNVFVEYYRSLIAPYYSYKFSGFVMAHISIAAVVFLFFKKKYDLALFLLFCTILPLMAGIVSMMRFVLWNPVFLLVVCYFLNKYRRFLYIILPIMAAMMMHAYFYFYSFKGENLWTV